MSSCLSFITCWYWLHRTMLAQYTRLNSSWKCMFIYRRSSAFMFASSSEMSGISRGGPSPFYYREFPLENRQIWDSSSWWPKLLWACWDVWCFSVSKSLWLIFSLSSQTLGELPEPEEIYWVVDSIVTILNLCSDSVVLEILLLLLSDAVFFSDFFPKAFWCSPLNEI